MKIRSERQAQAIIEREMQTYIENLVIKGYSMETIKAKIQYMANNYISYCTHRKQRKA